MSTEEKETTVETQDTTPEPEETTAGPYDKEVVLPSKGMFYDGVLSDGRVTLRPVSVQEEKLLAGNAGNRLELADKVLQKCIVSKCLPLSDLLMTDKFYLLLVLRSISYGTEYGFTLACGSCKFEFQHSVKLPEGLQLKVATEGDVEPFEVTLPACKKKVSLRFLRGYDEEEIENFVKTLPDAGKDDGDPGYPFRLSRFIDKIEGEDVDPIEKLQFCEKLIGMDSMKIRHSIAERETGPILTVSAKCPNCQTPVRSILPLTNDFFPTPTA